jgi:hypothetical protein
VTVSGFHRTAVLILLTVAAAPAQPRACTGTPLVKNYPALEYSNSGQVWFLTRDGRGLFEAGRLRLA